MPRKNFKKFYQHFVEILGKLCQIYNYFQEILEKRYKNFIKISWICGNIEILERCT